MLCVNPSTYKVTNKLFRNLIGELHVDGCPTIKGLLVHTIIYTLLVRISMDLNIV